MKFTVVSIVLILFIFISHNEIQKFAINVQKYEQRQESDVNVVAAFATQLASAIVSFYPQQNKVKADDISKLFSEFLSMPPHGQDLVEPIIVSTIGELKAAIKFAKPGDLIKLKAGTYEVSQGSLLIDKSGTNEQPISIVGEQRANTLIKVSSGIGVKVNASNVVIQNLTIQGECQTDDTCEHAIQVYGKSDNVKILGNILKNFNAHIKVNGHLSASNAGFPDVGIISDNLLYNEWPRNTAKPVTPIDMVGGSSWKITKNFIADFVKLKGNKLSYGAFMKGGGSDSVFSNNSIFCEWKLAHAGVDDARVGFSVGGGGTGVEYQRAGNCQFEYCGATVTGNNIANCPHDAAIYVNSSVDVRLSNNTFIATMGLQQRNSEVQVND